MRLGTTSKDDFQLGPEENAEIILSLLTGWGVGE